MAVHLLSAVHIDTRLMHVQDEVAKALMLDRIPIGAGEQQAAMGVMGAGGPDLLAVDDPLADLSVSRAGGGAREVGAAAGFTEQLAPEFPRR